MKMKNNLFANWDLMRIVRLGLGLAVIYQGYEAKEWMFAMIGSFFAASALFNVGCCSTNTCSRPNNSRFDEPNTKDVTYEEVR